MWLLPDSLPHPSSHVLNQDLVKSLDENFILPKFLGKEQRVDLAQVKEKIVQFLLESSNMLFLHSQRMKILQI